MDNVVIFWTQFFPALSSFLMSEPIIYFVAIGLLICVTLLIKRVVSN